MPSNGWQRGGLDDDIEAELEFHFAEAVDALVEQGWTERAARAEVARRFGAREKYERDLRRIGRVRKHQQERQAMEVTTSRWSNVPLLIESIARDVSYAGRLLWKDLTATVVTVISLSLAIGACTASFSLIDA